MSASMDKPTRRLAERHALVTGAGGGIGEAVARRLARDGAAVTVLDLEAQAAGRVAAAIRGDGGTALAVACDATRRYEFFAACRQAVQAHGPLAIMVPNAIWIRYEPFEQVTEDVLDRVLSIGIKAVFWSVQALLELRDPARDAAVVTFSSPAATLGFQRAAAYSATKGAVAAMTRQLATELGPRGVRVNAVAPGSIRTPGTEVVLDAAGWERRLARTPMGRLGLPEDIADAVAFLASDEARFISGQSLAVDGGFAIAGP